MSVKICIGCLMGIILIVWFAAEYGPSVYECKNWMTILRIASGKEELSAKEEKKIQIIRLIVEAVIFVVLLVINILGAIDIYTWIIPVSIEGVFLVAIIILAIITKFKNVAIKNKALDVELEEDDD